MFIPIAILFILACVLFFVVGSAVANKSRADERNDYENQLKALVKQYNEDTGKLHEENNKLKARNLDLDCKLRSIESDLISFKTKLKSATTDNERLKATQCDKKCKAEEGKESVKRGRKAKSK